jgi:nitrite reductase (cytochrome c-552)
MKKLLKDYWLVVMAVPFLLFGLIVNLYKMSIPKQEVAKTEQEAAAMTPKASNPDGVISADEWAKVFPDIVDSIKLNSKHDYQTDYLVEDPYLVELYEGYGFAKDYKSARGHYYDLDDIHETARPHAKANCLTCKTVNFTKLVNDIGVDAYTKDFEEVFSSLNEGISCYNCHGNNEAMGQLTVTHQYMADALGDNVGSIHAANVACGQCHTEYYFKPEILECTVPYSSLDTMGPEPELKYYKEIGYTDWTQESTGAKMLKAQHPEFETFLLGKHGKMLSCADCHMETVTRADGSTYKSHELVSPLESKTLLESCAQCHGSTDMVEFVHGIQEKVHAREDEVGDKLVELKKALVEANQSGKWTEDELNEVREIYSDAEWYFDWDYVENAEGAHNSELAYKCLDTSEEMINQAMEKIQAHKV